MIFFNIEGTTFKASSNTSFKLLSDTILTENFLYFKIDIVSGSDKYYHFLAFVNIT
jgi:hypothetical protein